MRLSKASKTPRNLPCTCGSGKKYKKCCLVKQQEQEAIQFKAMRLAAEAKEVEKENIDRCTNSDQNKVVEKDA